MTEETLGIQGFTANDKRVVAGSRFSTVRDAVFANPYQKAWSSPPIPTFAGARTEWATAASSIPTPSA